MPTRQKSPAKRSKARRFAQCALGGLTLAVTLWLLSQQQALKLGAAVVVPELLAPTRAMADKPLDVVFSDSILSLPSYLHRDERGQLAGKVIDLWDCVFKHAGTSAQYRLLPNRRSIQALLSGEADFHGARVIHEQGPKAFDGRLHYTDLVIAGYEVLLVRSADRQLLADELWWRQRVAVVRAEVVNSRVAAMGGEIAIRAANRVQALKLLVGKRVEVLLYTSNSPGEEHQYFQEHDISGRTLGRVNGHGLLSAERHRVSPDLLARINRGISNCRHLLINRDISVLP